MGVVLVGEGHVRAIEGEQAVIADRRPMGVAPEIPEDGGGAPEGRLGIDHPVGLEERVDEGAPRGGRPQVLTVAGEVELATVGGVPEGLDKLASKHPTEDVHGEEETRARRMNPPVVRGRESPRRHDAMDVRMLEPAPTIPRAQKPRTSESSTRSTRFMA